MTNDLETEPKKSTYQLGIIGFGSIGKIHYEALTIPDQIDFQVQGIADPQAKPVNDSLRLFSDYNYLLNNATIQAVSINTPPSTHYRLVMDALRAKKHVLVEKPPALTVAECEEMISFANQQQRVLFMAFHARYNPAVEMIRAKLAGKQVDKINIQYSEYVPKYHSIDGWIFNPEIAGGGALMDSGINALSIVTYVLPNSLFSIKDVRLEKAQGFKVETKARVDFLLDNRGVGTLSMDWLNKDSEVRQVTFVSGTDEYVVDIVKNTLTQNGKVLLSVDPTRKARDLKSEYVGVYRDFARHLAQGKSLVSIKELAFIIEAYRRDLSWQKI